MRSQMLPLTALCLSVLVVSACSKPDTTPTAAAEPTVSPSAPVDGGPTSPSGTPAGASWEPSALLGKRVTWPDGRSAWCIKAAEIDALLGGRDIFWRLTVTNAGPTGIVRFTDSVHHSDAAGCEPTTEHMRVGRVRLSGPTSYPPAGSGVTVFTLNHHEWSCGRVQVDNSADLGGGQPHVGVVEVVIDYGKDCPAALPPPSACPTGPEALAGAPQWSHYPLEERGAWTFTIRPDYPTPLRLFFATYVIAPDATAPLSWAPPLPQRLYYLNSGLYQPGSTYTVIVALPPAPAKMQADLIGCDAPPEVLHAGNVGEWAARTYAFWISP